MDQLLIWLPTTSFILLTIIIRLRSPSWAFPPAFFGLLWSVLLVLPLVAAPDYYHSHLVPWLLFSLLLALWLGAQLGFQLADGGAGADSSATYDIEVNDRLVGALVLAGTAAGMLAVLYLLATTGKGFSALFSLQSLVLTGNEYAIDRYHHGIEPPAIARILLAFTYAAAAVGGVFFILLKPLGRMICLTPFVPALMYTAVLTARSYVLYVLFIWAGAFLASLVLVHRGSVPFFTRRNVVMLSMGLLAIVALFVSLQMSRLGVVSLDYLVLSVERQKIWFLGYYSGLSRWLESLAHHQTATGGGMYSFAGLYDALGIRARVAGIFQDFLPINRYEATNVFTMYRGLLQDVGLGLALALQFLAGFVCAVSYSGATRGSLLMVGVLAVFYTVCLWSHVTHLLNYNTIILAYIILAGALVFLSRSRRHAELP